jgi:hypothetical protein
MTKQYACNENCLQTQVLKRNITRCKSRAAFSIEEDQISNRLKKKFGTKKEILICYLFKLIIHLLWRTLWLFQNQLQKCDYYFKISNNLLFLMVKVQSTPCYKLRRFELLYIDDTLNTVIPYLMSSNVRIPWFRCIFLTVYTLSYLPTLT